MTTHAEYARLHSEACRQQRYASLLYTAATFHAAYDRPTLAIRMQRWAALHAENARNLRDQAYDLAAALDNPTTTHHP